MPFTALHCAPVWLIFLYRPKRFDWIALSTGAVLPDILEPFMITIFRDHYWDVRVITHSLFGAITIMTLIAILCSLFIVPKIMKFFYQRFSDPRFHSFANIDVLRERGKGMVIFYSALIGVVSHVTIDLFYHIRNPILYPYTDGAILFFNDIFLSKIITTVITGSLFIIIAYKFWWRQ